MSKSPTRLRQLEGRIAAADARITNLYRAMRDIWAYARAGEKLGNLQAHLQECGRTAEGALAADDRLAISSIKKFGHEPRLIEKTETP